MRETGIGFIATRSRWALFLRNFAQAEVVTVRHLREWIEREVHLDLTKAPSDTRICS